MDLVETLNQAFDAATAIFRQIERAHQRPGSRPIAIDNTFGTWFRGHADSTWRLEPSVFRQFENGQHFEEENLFHHFQLVAPEYHQTHRNSFDWLCLMQHYGLPTRLLDWTENLLAAVYYAVSDAQAGGSRPNVNGRVFVLAPRILNRDGLSSAQYRERGIFVPESFHSCARAVLAKCATRDQWAREMASMSYNASSSDAERVNCFLNRNRESERLCDDKLTNPIAVFPNRVNRRLIAQAGVFTIHGGKYSSEDNTFPRPCSLNELNMPREPKDRFLWHFDVRADKKKRIADELMLVGIHKGTLFPELDQQASYLKDVWSRSSLGGYGERS